MSRRAYPEYKPSGVKWLGDVPEHWEVRRLKYISSAQLSNVDKNTVDGEEPIRLCNYVDVYYKDIITAELSLMEATATPAEISKFGLRHGDVLITKDSEAWDDIAVAAYVEGTHEDILCGYHLAQIRPNPGRVDGKYLFRSFYARGINDQFRVAATGITRYGLSKYWIDNGLFPVPHKDEQNAIAVFLDRETTRIDTLIEKKQRQIELLQEKRTAIISQAVTKGLDPNVKMKDSGIEWLGEIPEHWEVVRFKYVLWLQRGHDLPVTEFQEGEYPVCGSNGCIGYHSQYTTKGPGVTVGRSGSVGEVNYIDTDYWAHNTTLYVKIFLRANPRYSFYLLKTLDVQYLSEGTAVGTLNRNYIHDLSIAIPVVAEQRNIAAFLDRETARIDALIGKVRKSINLLREYRIALITAAVTGKIDVRKEVA